MTTTFNDILMGGSVPSLKFTEGMTRQGRIVAISEPYQEREYDKMNPGQGAPKFFPSGDPIMTFTIDLATNERDPQIEADDGMRRLYMDGTRIKRAMKQGIIDAGAKGLQLGATLTITCTHYDTPGDMRSGKNYQVQYVPPIPGANANQVLDAPATPVAQPTVAQPAPIQQQYVPQPAPAAAVPAPVAQPAAPVVQPAAAPTATVPNQAAMAAAMANLSPEQLTAMQSMLAGQGA